MTDISVMGHDQVAGVGGIRPLWNVLGEALKGRFSFEARKCLFSFQSYAHLEDFFVSRPFVRFGAKLSSSGAFGFDDVLELFLRTPLCHRSFSLRTPIMTTDIFSKCPIFFSKQSQCYLPDSYGDPQAEQSTLVFLRRKLEWKLDSRALARWSTEGPSIVVAIGTSRLRWSMVQKWKTHKVSVWLCEASTFPHVENQRVLRSLFPRPDAATVWHFALFTYADVQLQASHAAAREQGRKPLIRNISGVDHPDSDSETKKHFFKQDCRKSKMATCLAASLCGGGESEKTRIF